MRKKGDWSDATYRLTSADTVEKGVAATVVGETRARQGKGLDPLINPSQYGVVREANNLLVPDGDEFVLEFGVAMPVQTDFDTTGSMGGNVDVAFQTLPKVQNLLVQGARAVLKRYHTQIATGIIQDRYDSYPYLRSMFEPDNEVERQMGLLVPERDGGDATEDYQLGLFALAYLSRTSIRKYGLKGYYFIIGDEIGRATLDPELLTQVFGPNVMEKALGDKSVQSLPTTVEAARKALEEWHVFFLQVGSNDITTKWWSKLIGPGRVILLPRTEYAAEVEAVIIGLTEGVLNPQSAVDFLTASGASRSAVAAIVSAVRNIPVGTQATYPNFEKIPSKGSRFKSREDSWPIGSGNTGLTTSDDTLSRPEKPAKLADWKV